MSYPTYYISSSVVNVDTTTTSKILMLPTSSTIQGVPLYIRDTTGSASINPIYISTQTFDLIDNYASTLQLVSNYQSFSVVPYSTTRYAITLNYTDGLNPYQYALQLLLEFFEIALVRTWSTLSVSPSGDVMLAATNGGTNQGFYVSVNTGDSFSRYEARGGSFVASAVGTRYMYVAESGGYIYQSSNNGLSWIPLTSISPKAWVSIACNSDGDYIIGVTGTQVFWSPDTGLSWNDASFSLAEDVEFTACALGDAPSVFQDDIVVYITAQNLSSAGDYIYVCTNLTEGNPFTQQALVSNWTAVSCNLSGSIAYALNDVGALYKSTDTGSSWTLIGYAVTIQPYTSKLKCSSDGQFLFGIDSSGQRYLTEDGATSFTPVGPVLSGALNQYGLSSNGRVSLFAIPGTALYVGRTRIQ